MRLYRLHLVQSPLGAASVNSAMTAPRFFFSITLDRYDLLKALFRVEQPRKLPTVLTQEEVARKALVAVVQEAWIGGVSTRRVDKLVQAMGLSGISKSQVSKLCKYPSPAQPRKKGGRSRRPR